MDNNYIFTEKERPFVSKAEQYCANSEQCCSSVKGKLSQWGAGNELAEKIVRYLVAHEFIDETRYCRMYCESKMQLQKWGRIKIGYQLRLKHIERSVIDAAIQNIDEMQYQDMLRQLTQSKLKTLHDSDPRKRQSKLMSYLSSHGFTPDEIADAIREATANEASQLAEATE